MKMLMQLWRPKFEFDGINSGYKDIRIIDSEREIVQQLYAK